jgi:hypothetical protein
MLDVHPPHHPANGARDFFLHLFTITCGLLIAVGIEGLVERHQHREIAESARETLRLEIRSNADTLKNALAEIAKRKQTLTDNLHTLEHMAKTKDQHGSLNGTYETVHLQQTAWLTAQQTGALAYMPYDEAQRFSDIYNAQQQFLDSETKLEDDAAQFFGIIRRVTPDTETFHQKDFSDMGELFGRWQMHLLNLDVTAKEALEQDQAYLDGRKAQASFHEDMPQ